MWQHPRFPHAVPTSRVSRTLRQRWFLSSARDARLRLCYAVAAAADTSVHERRPLAPSWR